MILRILAALAMLAAAVFPAATAQASGPTVEVPGLAFSPTTVSTALGGTVTWHFSDDTAHTATSDQGFWNSGTKSGGKSYSRTFSSAGSFPYHCAFHSTMHGTVRVPLKASGSAADGWTLKWSTGTAGTGRTFDVQTRRSGTTSWKSLRTNTTTATAKFNPSRAGTYQVRARTDNTVKDASSRWSPVRSLTIS